MGTFGIWQWVIVLAIVLILFGGRGKISQLMGDFGKGLKSFKKGIKDDGPDDAEEVEAPRKDSAQASETLPEKEKDPAKS